MNFYEQLFCRGRTTGEGMTHFERLFAAKFGGSQPPKVREYTGTVPVTITADGTPLLDYLISGNMEQSGTPTPQNPITPQETGERTGNLLDVNASISGAIKGSPYSAQDYGTILSSQYTNTSDYIPITPNAQYTFRCDNQNPSATTSRGYAFYDDNKQVIVAGVNTIYDILDISTLTVTTPNTAAYMRISWDINATNLMLNTGSTPLPYEPYGYEIPISSAGQTTPIYLGEAESTRRIKELVLTGQETVIQSVVTNCVQIDVADTILDATIYSSHFRYVITVPGETARNGKVFHAGGAGAGSICFGTSSTPSNFKQWLSAQYSAGTPVTVWYVLATEETGIVNEPIRKIGNYADTLSMEQAGVQIPTNNGSTTIDVETTLKPSEVYIKYMG